MTRGRLGRWVVSQDRLRHGRGHGHDTTGCERDTARSRARGGGGGGGGGRRHGARACAATRPGVCCNTAKPGLRHGAVYAYAGPRVGALCTRLYFDSVHFSESLFGTLFMSIVHEVFKKKKF